MLNENESRSSQKPSQLAHAGEEKQREHLLFVCGRIFGRVPRLSLSLERRIAAHHARRTLQVHVWLERRPSERASGRCIEPRARMFALFALSVGVSCLLSYNFVSQARTERAESDEPELRPACVHGVRMYVCEQWMSAKRSGGNVQSAGQ